MPFKSAHWIFFNKRCLWKKNVARIVENMMTSHVFVLMVIANIAQTLLNQNAVVNIGRVLEMNKISVLYIAVNYKDADYFLTELFDKIHKKTLILETETCIVGTFIINSPHRTKTLRSAASYFLQSDKPFEMRISRIDELYNSLHYGDLWLGINAKEITKEQFIKILLYGDIK